MTETGKIRVLLVHRKTGSGNDVFFSLLERALTMSGEIETFRCEIPLWHERFPVPLPRGRFLGHRPRPHVVITHLELAGFLPDIDAPMIGVAHHDPSDPALLPHLSTIHRFYYRQFLSRQFHYGMAKSDVVVAVSRATEGILRRKPRAEKMRIETIPNGIDTDAFCLPKEVPKAGPPFRLLYVGNRSVRKGFDLLPRIMRELGPEYRLEVTGGLRDGTFEGMNPERIRSLGRMDHDALRAALGNAHALLFPSRVEGFGYAAVEAMACGCPVVGVDSTTLPELLPPDLKALLATDHQVGNLATATRSVCAVPRKSKEWRAWAVDRFGLERWGQDYLCLIGELIGRAPRSAR